MGKEGRRMTDQPEFDSDVFALYGQPSRHWDDGGITARIMPEVNPRDARNRQAALLASVLIGLVASAIALVLMFAPAVNEIATSFGAMPVLVWTGAAAILCLLAAAATKLVLE